MKHGEKTFKNRLLAAIFAPHLNINQELELMFFEGAEKKVELVVTENLSPLRAIDHEFWVRVVAACDATILSEIKNEHVDAYLLSESSLFVWDDRILMLTCGQTKLVESVLLLAQEFGAENFASVIFQRKNEYRSFEQYSSFTDDVDRLREIIPGTALRFGKIHSHHNLLFHSNKHFAPASSDMTTEMLMYDICTVTSHFLTQEGNKVDRVREFFQLDKVLPGFLVDDHCFEPYGYSLNAIKDDKYYTIHVTPQEGCPYVSFETNLKVTDESDTVLKHFLEILKPASFDVISFNASAAELDFGSHYKRKNAFQDKLSVGYDVEFGYYFKDVTEIEKPFVFFKD